MHILKADVKLTIYPVESWIISENKNIFDRIPIGSANINSDLPEKFSLSQNNPNPFNPSTKISFDIPKKTFTKLIVYNILGSIITTLVNELLQPGTYEVEWDAGNNPSGFYFYKLEAGDYTATKRMILIK
jgi:hypothetical protein